jgi:hypothetical protein
MRLCDTVVHDDDAPCELLCSESSLMEMSAWCKVILKFPETITTQFPCTLSTCHRMSHQSPRIHRAYSLR